MGGTNLHGKELVEFPLTVLQVRAGGWVLSGTPSEPAFTGKGPPLGGHLSATSGVQGFVPEDSIVSDIPC